jgi:pimeloyl-ACP methyl ester carboxylesterase
MDRIRQALGEDKLTFFGYSYGTVLAQVYAALFPNRVRALVLDGAVDISLGIDQLTTEQALGFEGALAHWLEDCDARRCVAGRSGSARDALRLLLQRAAQAPIPTNADRDASEGEVLSAIAASLYSRGTWNDLSRALNRGLDGDGTSLIRLVDRYLGRRDDGSYDNLTEMYNAVTCLDYAANRDPQHYRRLADELETKAPLFGRSFAASGLYCAAWPAEPLPLKTEVPAALPPVLVIGTTGDPATPYKWSLGVHEQMKSSKLLTFNGEGHTAYLNGDRCIDDAVARYLTELVPPATGASCGDPARSIPLKVAG